MNEPMAETLSNADWLRALADDCAKVVDDDRVTEEDVRRFRAAADELDLYRETMGRLLSDLGEVLPRSLADRITARTRKALGI